MQGIIRLKLVSRTDKQFFDIRAKRSEFEKLKDALEILLEKYE